MKMIVQSKWIGDTKWNYRGEAKNNLALYNLVSTITRQDRKLKTNNTYRVIQN